MAQPKVDEEKKMSDDQSMDKIIIPSPDKALIDKLPKQVQELYNYKAKYEINDDGSLNFYPTPNCEPGKQKFQTQKISMDYVLQKQDCKEAACYSNPDTEIIQGYSTISSFITSSLKAWSEHYPFRFRPEHIWLLILQAIAVHVDKNAEKLRSKYVEHDGKKKLTVVVEGDPTYKQWMSAIEEFGAQIDKNTVADTAKLFECDFSRSTITEKLATKVTIMDVCKNYFSYSMFTTCCGFPRITLDGTKQDWIKLKTKTVKLLNEKVTKKFGSQWGEALLPILDRFIVAFDGEIDCVFWNSMIKKGATHGSGARSWYSGWFNILFPFINENWNRFCVPYSMSLDYVSSGDSNRRADGNSPRYYPMSIASAPVEWTRMDMGGKTFSMKFLSGFVGYTQNEKTFEICPNIGWCIAYVLTKEELAEREKQQKQRRRW